MQKEITEETNILDGKGRLASSGWARKDLFKYAPTGSLRVKAWDFWELYNEDYRVILNIYDIGYLGVAQFGFTDFKSGRTVNRSITRLFPLGSVGNPNSLDYSKPLEMRSFRNRMRFSQEGNDLSLQCVFPKTLFGTECSCRSKITLDPAMDRMVNVIPFENPRHFVYAMKMNCVPLKEDARIILGEEEYVLAKDRSYAVLDWTRAVFPYRNQWKWCSASGTIKGKPFGFNLDYGFGTESSKNMIFYDHAGHHLDEIRYQHDKDDLTRDLTVTDNEDRIDLTLHPTFVEKPGFDIGILAMRGLATYGFFTGRVVLDTGESLEITEEDRLFGWAEDYRQKW